MLLKYRRVARQAANFGEEGTHTGDDACGCGLEVLYAVHPNRGLEEGEGAEEREHEWRAVHVDSMAEWISMCWGMIIASKCGFAFARGCTGP